MEINTLFIINFELFKIRHHCHLSSPNNENRTNPPLRKGNLLHTLNSNLLNLLLCLNFLFFAYRFIRFINKVTTQQSISLQQEICVQSSSSTLTYHNTINFLFLWRGSSTFVRSFGIKDIFISKDIVCISTQIKDFDHSKKSVIRFEDKTFALSFLTLLTKNCL